MLAQWIYVSWWRCKQWPQMLSITHGVVDQDLTNGIMTTVNAWRAAEIFPEFSAGNTTLGNPGGPGSVAVPANYPESFATGAI